MNLYLVVFNTVLERDRYVVASSITAIDKFYGKAYTIHTITLIEVDVAIIST